ncbi:MAG: hypothetical protein HN736_08705 [Anaerolineae bacterium]|jgi:hypothetical protein|nr:hypothetical protein [Anaerolineae bacterium]MBT3711727.1 hypothetical protein [Anaerolineae bacterium]MBT4309771.1 hypothetical protein [Anaerolineae bacterium]MBT4457992.1 hypothetical protein [Anaerolineae bacterium]MBT4841332.1 hypothetical protein [Anaerolineae bacterium]
MNLSTLPAEYWQSLEISKHDTDFLLNYLFELETPLIGKELTSALVAERIRFEQEAILKKQKGSGKVYLPKENYETGEELAFPALNWAKGEVTAVRAGKNPEVEAFDVMTVAMEGGNEHLFATGVDEHALNVENEVGEGDGESDLDEITSLFGDALGDKLATALRKGDELVSIADHWFPRSLLVDVNIGHLNLAEAILDMAEGEPLETSMLMKDIELPEGDNPSLMEFSLNFALKEDLRFDEVGSTGKVLWCLERLEPEEVRSVPDRLHYEPAKLDRSTLTDEMLSLEAKLDDELSKISIEKAPPKKAMISLLYPHWRLGTLPISERVRSFFPSAYESPRIRFTLVDGKSGEKMPAWVVKNNHYVYGLKEWYEEKGLTPGSFIEIRASKAPGEVIITAQTHRSKREWVRTVIAGSDGGLVFATLKQAVTAKFDDRMILAIPDSDALDNAWELAQASDKQFETLVRNMVQELTKLNPQGHVHAQELYSAVNLLKRCPPAPLFSLLATCSWVEHVGDLYFHLIDETATEKEV